VTPPFLEAQFRLFQFLLQAILKHNRLLLMVGFSPGKLPCFSAVDRYPSLGVGAVGDRTLTNFAGAAGGAITNWFRI
jgi:hypothetical protein